MTPVQRVAVDLTYLADRYEDFHDARLKGTSLRRPLRCRKGLVPAVVGDGLPRLLGSCAQRRKLNFRHAIAHRLGARVVDARSSGTGHVMTLAATESLSRPFDLDYFSGYSKYHREADTKETKMTLTKISARDLTAGMVVVAASGSRRTVVQVTAPTRRADGTLRVNVSYDRGATAKHLADGLVTVDAA